MNETSIDRVQGDEYCEVYTAETKFINKLEKLSEEHPDDIKYIVKNEDGSVLVHVPASWFRFVSPPKTMHLSEEERKRRSERLKKGRITKKDK